MSRFGRGVLIALVITVSTFLSTPAIAGYCWGWSGFAATDPEPWACGVCDDGVCPTDVMGQNIRHEHRNWHCSNPVLFTEPYGRAFLAFHRQFILDFDNWRLANTSLGRFEPWDPFLNAPVPGNTESTSTPFTNCTPTACTSPPCYCSDNNAVSCSVDTDCVGTCENIRPAGAICSGCQDLPPVFVGASLGSFTSLGEVGYNLEQLWHGSYHSGVSQLGCTNVGSTMNTTRDPAFWMAHKKLDEVSRDWQALKAADVVIVLDRSGSMDDNCSSTTPPLNEAECAINDAKRAAHLFAKIVQDVRMESGMPAAQQHRIGLASFSGSASMDFGLAPANGIATGDLTGDTGFEAALIGLTTGGATSIAAGIRDAITMLNSIASPNPHQAILILTDGKENTPPCLEGATFPCVSGDVLTAAEVGDIQIVAVGLGDGAVEEHLRDVAERHGGIFVAQANVNDDLSLTKFYVTAFGEIYDEGVSLDPLGSLPEGATASAPFQVPVCDETRMTLALGWKDVGRQCDMLLELTTPGGVVVDRLDPAVESGHSLRDDFLRVQLPYKGESTGPWTARILRPNGPNCLRQDYFYSVLGDGLGRVDPFVKRPDLTIGRNVLATFRLTESNRPDDDWDAVSGQVTLTRPDGPPQTLVLSDDGTGADAVAGNNVWSAEFPIAVQVPGVYHLRGHFDLTEGGCTKVRESEYSIVALPEPAECPNLACNTAVKVRIGETRPVGNEWCAWNRCASADQYTVAMSDSMSWLKMLDPGSGQLVDLPPDFLSEGTGGFGHDCFGTVDRGQQGGIQIFYSVPKTAQPGETSDVSVQIASVSDPQVAPPPCRTTLLAVGPPDCNMNGQDDAVDIATGVSRDEDFNGLPDECEESFHAPHVSLQLDPADLMWMDLGNVVYDVVRGDLALLHSTGGDFSAATQACIADDLPGLSFPHAPDPAPGQGVWFLVRYSLPAGHGSYISGGAGEAPGRDAGIAASGADCL